MAEKLSTQSKEIESNDRKLDYTKFSVILGRDLIFLDWTVNFGGQILGLIVGLLLGAIFGAKVKSLFDPDVPVDASAYMALEIGTLLCVLGLTLYYSSKLGISINKEKKVEHKTLNILKISAFAISAVFSIIYLFNGHLFPYVYSHYSSPSNNGNNSSQSGNTVDFKTTNQYILLLIVIVLVAAFYAILYAGVFYSFNIKVKVMTGVAIIISSVMMTFTLLSLNQSYQKLFNGEIAALLTDFFYFLLISLVAVLTYHLSGRVELSIIVVFIGFAFGFGAPSNAILQIIALKWGFPNLNNGINSIADKLAFSIQILEYAGMLGLLGYLIIFYKDTLKAIKELIKIYKLPKYFILLLLLILTLPWKMGKALYHFIQTKENNKFKKISEDAKKFFKNFVKEVSSSEGTSISIYAAILITIEIAISYLTRIFGILLYFLAFIALVGFVNKAITSKYGSMSYTALFQAMKKTSLELSSPLIPEIKDQAKALENKTYRNQFFAISLWTVIPTLIYYLVIYITTAITSATPLGKAIFLLVVTPLSVALMSFSLGYFFVKKPIIKEMFAYPIKVVSIIAGVVYYLIALSKLVNNEIGPYPIFSLFFILLIFVTIKSRKSFGELIFLFASEDRNRIINELIIRKDIDSDEIFKSFIESPSFLKFWLLVPLVKRGVKGIESELSLLLKSEFGYLRSMAALSLLYLQDQTSLDYLVKALENDSDENFRLAIAYGLRYCKNIPEEMYKRIIEAQHYEDNSIVLEKLKETISILDEGYSKKVKENEEEYMEEIK